MLLFLACTSEGTERPSEPDAPDTSADSSPADTTDSSGGDTADSSGGDTATAPPPTLTLGKAVRPMGLYSGLATTEEETRALVAEAADGGFGTFIPSVGGYTVWWNTTEADLDADYADALAGGVDLLQVAIDEAHARGLAVVPSVAVFPSPPLYATDPSWITRDRDGTPNSSYALAFSDPDARAAKLPLLLDLVCNYDVDGVFLDYTRYPGDDWGFDDPLLAAATAEGFDARTVATDSAEFARFRELRADSVTTFVSELHDAALACNADLRIGGFGGPDPEGDAAYYGRDYPAWARAGAVDDIYLAIYYESINDMRTIVADNRAAVGDDVALLGSLTVYDGVLSSDDELLRATREQAVGGVDGLWVYQQDWLESLDLWEGTANAQSKLERLLDPHPTYAWGWDARRDGAPGWTLDGAAMELDGDVLTQAAGSGSYTSSAEDTTLSGGTYAVALRGWPDTDLGESDRASVALTWADGAHTWQLSLDRDPADAGGSTGDLALPGDGVVAASWTAGVRPDESEPAWEASGSASDPAFVDVDTALHFRYASDADAENAGEYGGFYSPESPVLDMSVGGPGYRIDAVLRPADDLRSTGYSYECGNIALVWGDEEASYALCFDADSDDDGPGVTGSVAHGGYPITPLLDVDWSVNRTLTIVYDGTADTFTLSLDDGSTVTVARTDLAGTWDPSWEGRVFFGDTTTGGHAPDYDSDWASVSLVALGLPSFGEVAWEDEPTLAFAYHADDEVLYLYVDGVLTDWISAEDGAMAASDTLRDRVAFGNLGSGGHEARWQAVEVYGLE